MDRARWMVTFLNWRGYFGQRKGWLGEPTWNVENVFFPNRKEAEKYVRESGCDCCHRPPKKIVPNKMYSTGYADQVFYRPEPKRLPRGREQTPDALRDWLRGIQMLRPV